MQFTNWDIVARKGNKVGILWTVTKGTKARPYLGFWNFTLEESRWHKALALRMFRLSPWGLVLAVIGVPIIGWSLGHVTLGGEGALTGLLTGVAVAAAAILVALVLPRLRLAAFNKAYLQKIKADLKARAEAAFLKQSGVTESSGG